MCLRCRPSWFAVSGCVHCLFGAHSALGPVDDGVVLDHPVPFLAGCDGWVASAHHRGTGDLVGGDEAAVEVNGGVPHAGADVAEEEKDAEEFDEPQRIWLPGSAIGRARAWRSRVCTFSPVADVVLEAPGDANHADETKDLDHSEKPYYLRGMKV